MKFELGMRLATQISDDAFESQYSMHLGSSARGSLAAMTK